MDSRNVSSALRIKHNSQFERGGRFGTVCERKLDHSDNMKENSRLETTSGAAKGYTDKEMNQCCVDLHHNMSSFQSSSSFTKSMSSNEKSSIRHSQERLKCDTSLDDVGHETCAPDGPGVACLGYVSEYSRTPWTAPNLPLSQNFGVGNYLVEDKDLSIETSALATPKPHVPSRGLSSSFSSSSPAAYLSSLSLNPSPKTSSPYCGCAISTPEFEHMTSPVVSETFRDRAFSEGTQSRNNKGPEKKLFVEQHASPTQLTENKYPEAGKTQLERIQNDHEHFWSPYLEADYKYLGHPLLSPRGSNGSLCSRSSNADSAVDLLTPEEECLDYSNTSTESVDWFREQSQITAPQLEVHTQLEPGVLHRHMKLPAVVISDHSEPVTGQNVSSICIPPGDPQTSNLSYESAIDRLSNSNTSVSSNDSYLPSDGLSDLDDSQNVPPPKRKVRFTTFSSQELPEKAVKGR